MTGSSFYPAHLWCASALLLALSSGCEKSNAAAEKKATPPVKVEIGTPTEQEVTDFQDFTGR